MKQSLSNWTTDTRSRLHSELMNAVAPSMGTWDETTRKRGAATGQPGIGATVYFPNDVRFEFLYSKPGVTPVVFSVVVAAPERIVYMPVPGWVVEQIWEGEVTGSFAFSSEAHEKLAAYAMALDEPSDAFGVEPPRRRG